MLSGHYMNKVCKNCNCETERYTDGRCKPCVRKRSAQWAAKNKDSINARSRIWNFVNAEKKRTTNAAYRAVNQEEINLRRKLKRQVNPNIEKVKAAVRRARKLVTPGKLSKNIVDILLAQQNGCCACCEAPLLSTYHLDHILPLSLGGSNSDDNVQLLLPKCNLQKYNAHPEKFLARRQKERLYKVY